MTVIQRKSGLKHSDMDLHSDESHANRLRFHRT